MIQKRVHLIMPMGGKGSRFTQWGYRVPKPLMEIKGKPFFYWAAQSIKKFIALEDIVFVVLKEHVDGYAIDKKILKYYPKAIIIIIPEVLNGAVLTCMEGVKGIEDNLPVIVNDCDHIFRSRQFEAFACNGFDSQIDGGLLTFLSESSKYSYLKLNKEGNVIETAEKKVVSSQAICGCYYFSGKSMFMEAAREYLKECCYKEFFMSGVYNIMAESGKIIKGFHTDFHVSFGTPEEYEEAESSDYFDGLI